MAGHDEEVLGDGHLLLSRSPRRQLPHRRLGTQRLRRRHEVEEAGGRGPGAAPAGGTALRAQREALVAVEAEGELSEGQMDAGRYRVIALEHVSMHLRPGYKQNPLHPPASRRINHLAERPATGTATKCRRPNTNRNLRPSALAGCSKGASTLCTLSVRPRGPSEADGPFSATCARSLSEKARMTPLTKRLPLKCSRSERGLCPRNRILGGGSEGGRCPPPSVLVGNEGPKGLEVLAVGLEEPNTGRVHQLHDLVVDGRLHPDLLPLLGHVAVEIVDLGALPLHHILQHGGTASHAALRVARHLRLDLG